MRIAIIGSGISGLTASYLLHRDHEITVYEQDERIGGHAHTVDATLQGGTYPVDTGFIVFNLKTYPNFVKLLRRLGVPWKDSCMSFGVCCERSGLEYSPSSLGSLFAQRRNLLRPRFWRMLGDIIRFKRQYPSVLQGPVDLTLTDLLKNGHYSQDFKDYFIIPMGAAIWSADPQVFGQIPARFFVRFFAHHGFLNLRDQPQWLTIQQGSRQYVQALTRDFRQQIRLGQPVVRIQRSTDYVLIRTAQGKEDRFDQVIVATHSDQALRLLADPSEAEKQMLGSMPYQENLTVLHTDTAVLPRLRKAWASWNYRIPRDTQASVVLTYNMNMLQTIPAPATFCVTLNSPQRIDPAQVLYETTYAHPVFTRASVDAQQRHRVISGVNRTHYCGAYWGNGFHEDGVNSALAVCKHFGREL